MPEPERLELLRDALFSKWYPTGLRTIRAGKRHVVTVPSKGGTYTQNAEVIRDHIIELHNATLAGE